MKMKLENIRGFSDDFSMEENKQDEKGKNRTQLGMGFLKQREENDPPMKLIGLRYDQIKKNPRNIYSVEKIPELAESIRIMGLVSPLNVRQSESDEYVLLGGERRLTAIEQLIADPNVTQWTEETLIPCFLMDLQELDLADLSDDMRERFAIITTNKEARTYTDGDRFREAQEWKELIQHLREKGVDVFRTASDETDEKKLVIKKRKTRDILTEATGMSRGLINKIEKVNNQGSPKLIDAVRQNKVSIATAYDAVNTLNQEDQEKFIESGESLKKFSEKEQPKPRFELDVARFRKDTSSILRFLKEHEVALKPEDKKKYDRILNELFSLIVRNQKDS